MGPKVDGIRTFTAAIDRVADERRSLPGHDSRAMEELHAEQSYRDRSAWEQPITDTHTFGAMTLRAATEYVRAFGELFAAPQPPLYAHLIVGRSALEAAVVSAWLSQPNVSPLERIKRGLCEQLYSAGEVDRLGLPADDRERVAQWKAVADHFGWRVDVSRLSNPIVDGTRRPRVSDGIVSLAGSQVQSEVGNLLFSRMSAVAHVTWFGLQYALDFTKPERDGLSRGATVALHTDGGRVSATGFYLVRVLRSASTARFTLMGWSDPRWEEAVRQAIELEHTFARSALTTTDERHGPVA
jgi:hypothetical protein